MAEDRGERIYTRAELEEVARAAVCEAAEEAEPERVEQLAGRVLREFDEGRGSAAGYTAEQLSGTPFLSATARVQQEHRSSLAGEPRAQVEGLRG